MGRLAGSSGYLLACVLVMTAPRPAAAQSIHTSDCNINNFETSFPVNKSVCIAGVLDDVPPNKNSPEAYVYVVPAGYPNPFVDVSGGAEYVIADANSKAFFDVEVWPWPLAPGDYDLVIDNYPFYLDDQALFADPDLRKSKAFHVVAPVIFNEFDPYLLIDTTGYASDVLGKFVDLAEAIARLDESTDPQHPTADPFRAALVNVAFDVHLRERPTRYPRWITVRDLQVDHDIAALYAERLAAVEYAPDFDPTVIAGIDLTAVAAVGAPFTLNAPGDVSLRFHAIAQRLAVQSAAIDALAQSMNRTQGAYMFGDSQWIVVHAEKVVSQAQLARTGVEAVLADLDALELDLAGALDVGPDMATYNGWISDVLADGLDPATRDHLRSYGFSEAEIDVAAAAFAGLAPVPDDPRLGRLIAQLRAALEALAPALQNLIDDTELLRMELEPGNPRYAPRIVPSAAPPMTVGVASPLGVAVQHFDPAPTLTYAWDLDADGLAVDGDTPEVVYTPRAPGDQVVPVSVSDGALTDTAFIVVHADAVNLPPVVTLEQPDDVAPFAEVGEEIAFHLEATDPDGDPISYLWTVDGQPAGGGPDLDFVMPDEEAHQIHVDIDDDSVHSRTISLTKIVRPAKWEPEPEPDGTTGDATGDTTGDTTGGTSGDTTATADTTPDIPTGGGSSSTEASTTVDAPTSDGEGSSGHADPQTQTDDGGCGCRSEASGAPLLALLLVLRRRAQRSAVQRLT